MGDSDEKMASSNVGVLAKFFSSQMNASTTSCSSPDIKLSWHNTKLCYIF